MKVLMLSDYTLGDVPLIAGQSAIVSDEDGAQIIAAGAGELRDENERGGFAVPMTVEE